MLIFKTLKYMRFLLFSFASRRNNDNNINDNKELIKKETNCVLLGIFQLFSEEAIFRTHMGIKYIFGAGIDLFPDSCY